jgi:hypothetical protein
MLREALSPAVSRGAGEGFSRAGCLASVRGGMALIFIGRHFGWG